MSNNNHKSAQVQVPTLLKKIQEESDRQLAEIKPQLILPDSDTGPYKAKPAGDKPSFHDAVYMFPPSYNLLRQELVTHWPALWARVSWSMAFKAEEFVERMNDALNLKVQLDSEKVGATCQLYLDTLINLRRNFRDN